MSEKTQDGEAREARTTGGLPEGVAAGSAGDSGPQDMRLPVATRVTERTRWMRASRVGMSVLALSLVGILAAGVLLAGCGEGEDTSGASVSLADLQPREGLAAVGARNTITVIGRAEVTSAPDEAVLTLSVETDGADPAKALDANSERMRKMIDRLKAEGIDDEAIETASVTVHAIRTWHPDTGKEILTGYRAQNMVTVTLRDALKVGKVLAAAVEAGATNVSGPVWRLSEDSAAVAEALTDAVADARAKAEAVAAAQGVRLGGVLMVNEGGVDVPDVVTWAVPERAGDMAVAEPPISPTAIDVTATITVTYALER